MMRRDIAFESEFSYPPDELWRALTDPAALSEWLMPVHGFKAVVGQRFRIQAKPMPGWDGVVNCEVLEVDEPRRLAFTWQGSRMRTRTTVTWTLVPLDGGRTLLRLDHQGFTGVGGSILAFMHRSGWRKFTGPNLGRYLGKESRSAA